MQRVVVVIVIAFFCTTILACNPKITPEEAKVLVSLDEIQRGFESNIDYSRFVELLKTTKAEIVILKKNDLEILVLWVPSINVMPHMKSPEKPGKRKWNPKMQSERRTWI